eukprot:805600-Pelagomonas_calceolata.AAC.1
MLASSGPVRLPAVWDKAKWECLLRSSMGTRCAPWAEKYGSVHQKWGSRRSSILRTDCISANSCCCFCASGECVARICQRG